MRCLTTRRSALGDSNGFNTQKNDVSSLPKLFPANVGRRSSVKRPEGSGNRVKAANESDVSRRWHRDAVLTSTQIEESDAEES